MARRGEREQETGPDVADVELTPGSPSEKRDRAPEGDSPAEDARARSGAVAVCPTHGVELVAHGTRQVFTIYRCPADPNCQVNMLGGLKVPRRAKAELAAETQARIDRAAEFQR